MRNEHGGKREGAGRPREAASVAKSDKIVKGKLRSQAEMGFEILAESYPNIMRAAVKSALGPPDGIPNTTMLRSLLELMTKIVGTEPDQGETPMTLLVKGFLDRLPKDTGTDSRPTLAGSSGRNHGATDGRDTARPAADSIVSGVELGLRVLGND